MPPKSTPSDYVPVAEEIMAAEDEERRATYAHFADQLLAVTERPMPPNIARLITAWLIESLRG
jgi:hypothetical protein